MIARLVTMLKLSGLFLTCFFLGCAWGFGAGGLRFVNLSHLDGLSQASVNHLIQDQRGFIWVSTKDGLNRFDGFKFTTYRHNPDDPGSLMHGHVHTMYLDQSGDLWVGTAAGLDRYDEVSDRFEHHVPPGPLGGRAQAPSVTAIAPAPDGKLWVGTWGSGLFMFTPGQGFGRNFVRGLVNGLDQDRITDLHQGRNGILWIGTASGGLVRYDVARDHFQTLQHQVGEPLSLSDNDISVIREDRGGRLWVGHASGVDLFDPLKNSFSPLVAQGEDWELVQGRAIEDICFGEGGIVWLGSKERGLFRVNMETGETLNALTANQAQGDDHIQSLFLDRSGILWVGGAFNGIYRHDPTEKRFQHVRHAPDQEHGLAHPCVYAIARREDGTFFFGTPKGLTGFDPVEKTFVHYERDLGTLDLGSVQTLCFDGHTLWMGSGSDGLALLTEDGSIKYIRKGNRGSRDLLQDQIHSIARDHDGVIWVGTSNGLNRYYKTSDDFDGWQHQGDDATSLSGNEVRVVYPSASGDLWVGTLGAGLNRTDLHGPGAFQRFTADGNGLRDNQVTVIKEDLGGQIWVGTAGGLHRFDGEGFSWIGSQDGLPADFITSIEVDGRNRLWLSTTNGFASYDQHEKNFRVYDAEDGLINVSYNARSSLITPAGEIFLGGLHGVDHFFPSFLGSDQVSPPVVITRLRLFDRSFSSPHDPDSPLLNPIHLARDVYLKHDDDAFALEFAALHFANPNRNRYAYQLEGVDSGWVYTDASKRTASYTHLPSGQYQFRIKAANKDGVWSKEPATLMIHVLPPWWRTWWAYGTYLVLLGFLVLRLMRARYEKLKHSNRELAQLVRARTAEIDKQRKVVEAQNKRLESQNSQLENQKREIEAQTVQLRRLYEEKSRFFADISHEFRTPLTLNIGPLEDILSGQHGTLEAEQRPYLDMMLRNSKRLLNLINQLLDVSKLEAGEMKLDLRPGDLSQFVANHILSFAPQAERARVSLITDISKVPLITTFDSNKLQDILDNLLSNAFKFTQSGDEVHVGLWRSRQMAVLSVRDTGEGIPSERLPHIFKRFFASANEGETPSFSASSGIGLALVQELVSLHAGRIEVNSKPEVGSEFLIYLPLNKETTFEDVSIPGPCNVEAEMRDVAVEPACDGRKVVLIIDDNADIRTYLSGILSGTYDVAEATGGKEGLELACRLVPDVVICDVMMPEPDGFEVCRRLKTDVQTSHVPVMMLTALATDAHKIQGLEGGADDYLVKPFNAREVHLRVDNLIHSRELLREKYTQDALGAVQLPCKNMENKPASVDDKFLLRVVGVVNEKMADPQFGVASLAEEVGLSRRQLLRKINALTGQSPTDFVRRLRLEHAAEMLRYREGNVSEVAYAVGFETPAHFSKLFRKQFGVLPSEVDAKVSDSV